MLGFKKIVLILIILLPISLFGQDKRADKLFKAEDYKGSLTSYLKSYEKEPTNYKLADKIGKCYINLQDYLIASVYFKEAARLAPYEETYQMQYAEALIYAMEIDRAELYIEEYLAENPDSEEAKRLYKLAGFDDMEVG